MHPATLCLRTSYIGTIFTAKAKSRLPATQRPTSKRGSMMPSNPPQTPSSHTHTVPCRQSLTLPGHPITTQWRERQLVEKMSETGKRAPRKFIIHRDANGRDNKRKAPALAWRKRPPREIHGVLWPIPSLWGLDVGGCSRGIFGSQIGSAAAHV